MAKKRKITAPAPPELIVGALPTSHRSGASGNSGKGLLSCPVELQTEILDYFVAVTTTAHVIGYDPVLPPTVLERTDILRSLSQVSLDYRRVFLPLLYETVNICVARRPKGGAGGGAFYKHVGETLNRKMNGLGANPELASYVQKMNVVLTRYQSGNLIPLFASTIANFPNLHTLHILHAHTQMTTALKVGFAGVTLPSIRILVIPGHGHEILRSCPNVKSVWATSHDDGSKVVTVIAKHCKVVEEIRGFRFNQNILKRLVKAAPGLKTIGIDVYDFDSYGELDPCFKSFLCPLPKFCAIIIRTDNHPVGPAANKFQKCIKSARAFLNSLPPRPDRKSLRLWHIRDHNSGGKGWYIPVDLGD